MWASIPSQVSYWAILNQHWAIPNKLSDRPTGKGFSREIYILAFLYTHAYILSDSTKKSGHRVVGDVDYDDASQVYNIQYTVRLFMDHLF